MDFPGPQVTPLFVHTWTRWGAAQEAQAELVGGIALASLTWPVANTAFYIPVWLPWPYQVERVFWVNGSSVTSTNMDFGIYTADGTRIYSTGSTAAAGASAPQYVTPGTDMLLVPGRYYFALADSSITANRGGAGSTGVSVAGIRMAGLLQEASALPLPAIMTPSAVANSMLPVCGVTRTTTGF
jgi:hypothetical protein